MRHSLITAAARTGAAWSVEPVCSPVYGATSYIYATNLDIKLANLRFINFFKLNSNVFYCQVPTFKQITINVIGQANI